MNLVDISSPSLEEDLTKTEYLECGPSSFSNAVKRAFLDEIRGADYFEESSYNSESWIVIVDDIYCSETLDSLFDISNIEYYSAINVVGGTWNINFESGIPAYETLLDWDKTGKLWGFYPERSSINQLRYEPNDPLYISGDQWHLDNYGQKNGNSYIDINPQKAWDNYTGNGIYIGIIDDGIDYNNPDLSANFVNSLSYDYCDDDDDVFPSDSDNNGEVDWHGTAVAGISSAKGNNSLGITGVAYNSNLIGIRLVADSCSTASSWDSSEASALTHELEMVDIYTNSWGPSDSGNILGDIGPLALAALEKGVNEGRDGLGSVYVWAAGNGHQNRDNSNKDAYANSRYTVAVGAINWKGERTEYSEPGSNIMLVAPSHNSSDWIDPGIYSTDISGAQGHNSTDYLNNMGGTSASTPMVAGVIALMLEANPDLTWRDIQHILVRTSKKVDSSDSGWFKTFEDRDYNHQYGYGLVDASSAVKMAESWQNIPSEVNVNTGNIDVNEIIFDGNDIGRTSKIFVNESIDIETVQVEVNISHDWRGDLNLFLESPNGIVSELVRESNDNGSNYHNWKFTSVVHWDENSFGLWKLKVNDTDVSYLGTWNYWNMTFYGHPSEDTDGDNLTDFAESVLGTGYNNPDWDNDGLLDGEEYYGWFDLLGNFHLTDLKVYDSDNDGLNDWLEGKEDDITSSITDPNDNDTDDDGLLDGCEIYGLDNCDNYVTNPLKVDTDDDGISDFNEIFADLMEPARYRSNPTKADTDNDTMPDLYELENGFNPNVQVDGLEDSDCDGIQVQMSEPNPGMFVCTLLAENSKKFTNAQEYLLGTDPNDSDSDLDGLPDGWEYYFGLNPLEIDSHLDLDNDTIPNIYEYDNFRVDTSIFSPINSGLRAYWKFDNNDPLFALDSSGNGFMAFMTKVDAEDTKPTRLSAKFSSGISCSGDSSHLTVDSIQNTKFTEYTVQTWVKLTNYTNFGTIFGTSTDGRTWLGIDSEGFIQFKVFSGNTLYATPLVNDSKALLNVWYHVAATYSETDNSLRLYVNGTLASNETISSSHSINTAGNKNYICRGQNGDYLNGTVDNIAIWGRAFTEDEIEYFYERPLGINNYFDFRVDDGIRYTNPNSTDTDGDGLSDREEFYIGFDGYLTDPTNNDTDGDGLNDYLEWIIFGTDPTTNDTDSDNVTDDIDLFPFDSTEWIDTDGDGVGDNADFFPFDFNESKDSDLDGLGDNLELLMQTNPFLNDTDGDGSIDSVDKFPLNSSEYLDSDSDGYGDNSDKCPEDSNDYLDSDNDGFCDNSDAFPLNPNESKDSDSDGYGDNSDKYPNDATKYSDPVQKIEKKDPLGEGTLDLAFPYIIMIGAVYFIFKYFRK